MQTGVEAMKGVGLKEAEKDWQMKEDSLKMDTKENSLQAKQTDKPTDKNVFNKLWEPI